MRKNDLLHQFLSCEDMDRIRDSVAAAELGTSAEIRVVVRQKRGWQAKLLRFSVQRLALEAFSRFRMEKTKDRNGVILFFLLETHKFYIYGDQGIHAHVGQEAWNTLAKQVSQRAATDGLCVAIQEGIASVGKALAQYFPRQADDVNELPDDVAVE